MSNRLEFLPVSAEVRDFIAGHHGMMIGGEVRDAIDGAVLPIHDPASGKVIAEVPAGKSADVDAAVAAARAAFEGPWRRMRPADRERLLLKLADAIEADGEFLASVETANNGKSITIARNIEVAGSVEHVRYTAGWATKIYGQTLDVSIPVPPGAVYRAMTRKEPVGVVGAIIPWNFPLIMAVWKIAPALAAGCTIVLKPAEETPLTALRLGHLCRDVGIPDGVVNIVTGYGHEAGAALACHKGIGKIAFTGSTEIGKLIGHAAIDNMTRLSLELGGKSPMIMFDDMNVDLIGLAANLGAFFNQGQVCTCGSRVLAQRGVYGKVVDTFVRIADGLSIGSGFDPGMQINPLVSAKQQKRVLGMIGDGNRAGATIAAGGAAHGDSGYYVKPTVLTGVTPDMRVYRDEVFGPVVTILPFDTFDEAIALANDSEFGLAASVWSRDISTCYRAADSVRAGTVWINTHNLVDPNMPFGGYKQSGLGREHGASGIENYLETKSICVSV
ncbi:MAG TPA: aldehyde dehydrogenase family protein [Acidiphilium sp.]